MGDPNKVTIIACSGDLDKAYPILILASTAAASGKDVTIFFSFWGLFIIKKNDGKIIGKDWMTKMLSWLHRGGSERLKLSQYRMGGMGTWMMNQVFRKNKVAKLSELLDMCQELGVRMIPCQMTMDAFGMTMNDLITGVDQPVGAATALEYASDSGINWFI
ncbi:MAG TPA: DsrE/DsrF/DrsH-like family protein [Symbiobacteriaceae bacterium]|nr:DsrE/DsrF/DrsH-like family protein [Symbiobacteriaceae bacterium]